MGGGSRYLPLLFFSEFYVGGQPVLLPWYLQRRGGECCAGSKSLVRRCLFCGYVVAFLWERRGCSNDLIYLEWGIMVTF